MMKKQTNFWCLFLCLFCFNPLWSQSQLNWFGFEKALEMNGQRVSQGLPAKKIFVDVYTDWCGWCKRMDATTFSHPEIVRYMSEHFIASKLNAERKDTLNINGQIFAYVPSAGRNGIHELAVTLLRNQMSYPSCTFLNENGQQLDVVPGYMDAKAFESLLHYFGEDAYKKTSWEDFKSTFKGHIE